MEKYTVVLFGAKRFGCLFDQMNLELQHVLKLLSGSPGMGQVTKREGLRRYVIGNFALFYRIGTEEPTVEAVIDARQNIPLD